MILCDNLIDMAVANIDGSTITTPILDAGTQGTPQGVWSIVGTAPTVQSSGGTARDRLDEVGLRDAGLIFNRRSTHRRIAFDTLNGSSWLAITTAGGTFGGFSVGAWITLGPLDQGVGGSLFDLVRVDDLTVGWAVIQLQNGNAPNGGGYAVNLHTNPGGVTTYTGHFVTTQNSTHWFSLWYDAINFTSQMDIYDTNGVLEYSTTASTNAGSGSIAKLSIGNSEVGSVAGTTYFENMVIDWTEARKPLGPWGLTDYYLPKSGGGKVDTSSLSLTSSAVPVRAGDLVFVGFKYESTATALTCTDALGNNLEKIVEQANVGANGEPHGALFWYLAPASGGLTFKVSLAASRPFLDIVVLALTPSAPILAIARDGTPVGNSAASGSAFTTGNITTNSKHGIAAAHYAQFGSDCTVARINSKFPDAFFVATGSRSALWVASYEAGFTGQATATLSSASFNWTGVLAALDVTFLKLPPNRLVSVQQRYVH